MIMCSPRKRVCGESLSLMRYTFCDSRALVCEHFARSRYIAICAHSCNNTTRAFSGRLRAPTVCIFMGHGGRNNVVYAHSS